jgi:hypothetical protein
VNRLVESLVRRSGIAAAAMLLICTPALAEPVATGPILPERVVEHFRDLGVSVDPRQRPAVAPLQPATAAEADAPAASEPMRVGVFKRGTSATIATIPINGKSYATVWLPGPSFAGSRVERLTAVDPEGRATAALDGGRLKKIADDRGQFVALGRNGSRRTLTVDFDYGYKHDRRVVELPDDIDETEAIEEIAASTEPAATAEAVGKRKVRLKVKVCKHWPRQAQLLDAWIDINPKHLPDGRAPASFPLEQRVGTIFGGTINTAKLAEVRRDPAKVTAAVGSAAESVCATIGKSKKRDLCSALGGEQAATIACRGILAPFSETFCPAVRDASGWKPVAVDEHPNTFAKSFEVRFNARFLSPYGYAWVSSSKPKKYGPRSEMLEEKLELPCWDVYEAPVKMTGSYQWPTCFSPYAEANATVHFANYMKGWYAWAALSNWKLTVFQTQDCLSSNYVEGPFTPAGGAKLDGGYAHWTFSNAKWGGPDNFEAHINFAGDKMWGNVKDSRRGRHTSERATLYGEFSGKRAK